jgi:hypothetical protein
MRVACLGVALAVLLLGSGLEARATGVCTQPVPMWIAQAMQKAGDNQAALQQTMTDMQRATDNFCRDYQQTPSADNSQDIGFGCTLYSGILYGERVYWSLCAGGQNQAATAPPDPNVLIWQFQNQTPYTLALAFYSQDSDSAWPGGDQAYVLNDRNPHSYPLTCIPGEHICFGAWYDGNPEGNYWGAGFERQQGCDACCFTCGANVPLIPLGP